MCPYCGAKASFAHAETDYGTRLVSNCPTCGAASDVSLLADLDMGLESAEQVEQAWSVDVAQSTLTRSDRRHALRR